MSPQIREEAFRRVDFDRELVFKFFTIFSLFEYALKEAGFWRNSSRAEPDWVGFIHSIESSLRPNLSNELNTAVSYLLKYPPMQQRINNGQMGFEPCDTDENNSEIQWLSIFIRRVRNNLFHGGKYKYDRPRDTLLIQCSLIILEEWATLNQKVRRALQQGK